MKTVLAIVFGVLLGSSLALKAQIGGAGNGSTTISNAPGGSNTQVQFNDSNAFGGDSGLVFNKTTDALTIAGILQAGGYKSSDGTAGATVTTCTGFKNGLCISGT